jgi:hypothetical protein
MRGRCQRKEEGWQELNEGIEGRLRRGSLREGIEGRKEGRNRRKEGREGRKEGKKGRNRRKQGRREGRNRRKEDIEGRKKDGRTLGVLLGFVVGNALVRPVVDLALDVPKSNGPEATFNVAHHVEMNAKVEKVACVVMAAVH